MLSHAHRVCAFSVRLSRADEFSDTLPEAACSHSVPDEGPFLAPKCMWVDRAATQTSAMVVGWTEKALAILSSCETHIAVCHWPMCASQVDAVPTICSGHPPGPSGIELYVF